MVLPILARNLLQKSASLGVAISLRACPPKLYSQSYLVSSKCQNNHLLFNCDSVMLSMMSCQKRPFHVGHYLCSTEETNKTDENGFRVISPLTDDKERQKIKPT